MEAKIDQREYWLDLVKGLAIIGVVLQHSLQRSIYYFSLNDTFLFPIANDFVASVNMKWFFAVSGYVYFSKREKYFVHPNNFYKTRFIDLMIPYLILAPLIWLGKFTLSAYVKNQVSLDTLLNMFTTPIAFMWFIYVLFFVEVIIYTIDKLTQCKFTTMLWVTFLAYLVVHLLVGYGDDVFRRVPYFCFWYCLGGIFVCFKKQIYRKSKSIMACGGGIWVVFFIIHVFTDDIISNISNVIYCLGSLLFICLFFKRNSEERIKNKILNYLGNKTMYIYILNPIIINSLRQFLVKIDFANILWINFFVFLLGTIIIACVIAEIGNRFAPLGFIFTPRKYLIKGK